MVNGKTNPVVYIYIYIYNFYSFLYCFSDVAYDFMGCHWHAHTCQRDRTSVDVNTGHSMRTRYNLAMLRYGRIKNFMKGQYIVIWECEFDKGVKENECFRDFVSNFNIRPPPLRIRDALAGGRTEPIYTLHDCSREKKDKIRYLDYCVSIIMSLVIISIYVCK